MSNNDYEDDPTEPADWKAWGVAKQAELTEQVNRLSELVRGLRKENSILRQSMEGLESWLRSRKELGVNLILPGTEVRILGVGTIEVSGEVELAMVQRGGFVEYSVSHFVNGVQHHARVGADRLEASDTLHLPQEGSTL